MKTPRFCSMRTVRIAILAPLACSLLLPLPGTATAFANGSQTIDLGKALLSLFSGGRSKISTTLQGENLRVFNKLKVSRKRFDAFAYRQWPRCSYSFVQVDPSGKIVTEVVTSSSKQVRERYLISTTHSKGTSTTLVGANGEVFDYNVIDPDTGERYTRENFKAKAAAKLKTERTRNPSKAADILILDPTAMTPSFSQTSFRPGETVKTITRQDGSAYADMVYGGLVKYKDKKALLLEVIGNRDARYEGGPILIGYMILNQDDMMPLKTVIQIGYETSMDLIQCF